jgi:cell division topological specificity factor
MNMSLLRLFKSRISTPATATTATTPPSTAEVARERLQILLAHERGQVGGKPDLLVRLREEILAVVNRHVTLDPDKVVVRMDRGKHVSTLEVDIELPNEPPLKAAS